MLTRISFQMPPRKSGESLQSQCIKRVAWMVTPLIALEDQVDGMHCSSYYNGNLIQSHLFLYMASRLL